MILAGDIGGTKVHLALYNFAQGRLQPVRDQKFPAHQYSGLEAIVNEFLSSNSVIPSAVDGSAVKPSQIFAACFGCPGPVIAGKLKLTNLPWELDSRVLSKSLGIEHVFLINDLQANGYGIPEVAPENLHPACWRRHRHRQSRPGLRRDRSGRGSAHLERKIPPAHPLRGRPRRLRRAHRH